MIKDDFVTSEDVVLTEELVEGFTADGELTPIDIVSEVTGLTYEEIRSSSKIVLVEYSNNFNDL